MTAFLGGNGQDLGYLLKNGCRETLSLLGLFEPSVEVLNHAGHGDLQGQTTLYVRLAVKTRRVDAGPWGPVHYHCGRPRRAQHRGSAATVMFTLGLVLKSKKGGAMEISSAP